MEAADTMSPTFRRQSGFCIFAFKRDELAFFLRHFDHSDGDIFVLSSKTVTDMMVYDE